MQYIHFYICILSFEAIFNESTIAALRHHTETIEWLQTARLFAICFEFVEDP